MSKKNDTVWRADPHTIAKLEILSSYLKAYFPILGTTRPGQTILIIDGFSGPDLYANHQHGSPTAALKAAEASLSALGITWKAGRIHFAFIEQDKRRFELLENSINTHRKTLPPGIVIDLYNTSFEKGLEEIKCNVPQPFISNHPLFVFIDPFGAKGAPFTVVAGLLKSKCSEVLINFDADGIVRILRALNVVGNEAILTSIFGDESWRNALKETRFSDQCEKLRELYLARLRSLPNVRFVYSFAMHTTANAVNYHLVFASQHHRGLEKMKEAMKKMGHDGSFKFSDDRHRSGQYALILFDSVEEYAPLMHEYFTGRIITYDNAREYALNFTPFTNPKKCLAFLEKAKLITVKAKNPKRRTGDFLENDIEEITFTQVTSSLF